MQSLKLKRKAARSAERLGHELGAWHHDLLCLVAVTECRLCGATVRIRHGEIRGDATTDSCREWSPMGTDLPADTRAAEPVISG